MTTPIYTYANRDHAEKELGFLFRGDDVPEGFTPPVKPTAVLLFETERGKTTLVLNPSGQETAVRLASRLSDRFSLYTLSPATQCDAPWLTLYDSRGGDAGLVVEHHDLPVKMLSDLLEDVVSADYDALSLLHDARARLLHAVRGVNAYRVTDTNDASSYIAPTAEILAFVLTEYDQVDGVDADVCVEQLINSPNGLYWRQVDINRTEM